MTQRICLSHPKLPKAVQIAHISLIPTLAARPRLKRLTVEVSTSQNALSTSSHWCLLFEVSDPETNIEGVLHQILFQAILTETGCWCGERGEQGGGGQACLKGGESGDGERGRSVDDGDDDSGRWWMRAGQGGQRGEN